MSYPDPVRDKLTYLCYYLAVKAPHVLKDAENHVGGMLAENSPARQRADEVARELARSYDQAHAVA